MSSRARESADNPYVPLSRMTDEMAGKTPRRFGLPEALVVVTVAVTLLAILLPPVKSSVRIEQTPAAFQGQPPEHDRSASDHTPGDVREKY